MESSDLKCGSKSIISYLVTYFGPDQLSSAFFAKVSETLPDIKKTEVKKESMKIVNTHNAVPECFFTTKSHNFTRTKTLKPFFNNQLLTVHCSWRLTHFMLTGSLFFYSGSRLHRQKLKSLSQVKCIQQPEVGPNQRWNPGRHMRAALWKRMLVDRSLLCYASCVDSVSHKKKVGNRMPKGCACVKGAMGEKWICQTLRRCLFF